jgi:hypothetical protein
VAVYIPSILSLHHMRLDETRGKSTELRKRGFWHVKIVRQLRMPLPSSAYNPAYNYESSHSNDTPVLL